MAIERFGPVTAEDADSNNQLGAGIPVVVMADVPAVLALAGTVAVATPTVVGLASTAGLSVGQPVSATLSLGGYTATAVGVSVVTVTGGGLVSAMQSRTITDAGFAVGTFIESVLSPNTCTVSNPVLATSGTFVVAAVAPGTAIGAIATNVSVTLNSSCLAGSVSFNGLNGPGAPATIYSDDNGLVLLANGTCYTDDNGQVTFTAQPGDYWMSVTGGKQGPYKVEVGAVENYGSTYFLVTGVVAVANNVKPPGDRVEFTGQVTSVVARVGTAPVTTPITIRINKNSANQGTVTIAAAATSGSAWSQTGGALAALPMSVAAGDILTFDVTAIGTGTVGSDLAIDIIGNNLN